MLIAIRWVSFLVPSLTPSFAFRQEEHVQPQKFNFKETEEHFHPRFGVFESHHCSHRRFHFDKRQDANNERCPVNNPLVSLCLVLSWGFATLQFRFVARP